MKNRGDYPQQISSRYPYYLVELIQLCSSKVINCFVLQMSSIKGKIDHVWCTMYPRRPNCSFYYIDSTQLWCPINFQCIMIAKKYFFVIICIYKDSKKSWSLPFQDFLVWAILWIYNWKLFYQIEWKKWGVMKCSSNASNSAIILKSLNHFAIIKLNWSRLWQRSPGACPLFHTTPGLKYMKYYVCLSTC